MFLGPAQAENDQEIFRFREPIVVANESEIISAVAVGSSIQVEGVVKESAVALGGDVIIGSAGAVEGDAIAIGGHVIKAPGAHVGGKVTSVPISFARFRRSLAVALPTLIIGMGALVGAAIVFGSLGSVALALLVLALFPDQTEAARKQIDAHPAKTFIFGFIALILTLPVLVFLTITIIGIPLAFVVAVLVMAALVLGTVALGQWIGFRLGVILKRSFHPMFAGLIGLFLMTAIAAIHFIGVLAQGVIVCMALGSVAFSRFRAVQQKNSELKPL